MRVAVTGAAGHLGSHLVPLLVEDGFEVVGLDAAEPARLPAHCSFVRLDLADAGPLREALEGVALVVHCASIHPWKAYSDHQYLDANVKGTWSLYATAADLGLSRVVLTSSIAAAGYSHIPTDAWPVTEDRQFPLGDLYSLTKHAQEDIARLFADAGKVRTIALRPPAFMPRPGLETGFLLTANFALVEDIASAHAAAARVLAGRQAPGAPLGAFEVMNVTNRLPYTREDIPLLEPGRNVRPLVRKHWPEAYEWLVARGYQGTGLVALYDLSRAERLLGWRPQHSFEEWIASQVDDAAGRAVGAPGA